MPGTLYTVGVGPGDPELITVKAARIIASVPVVAYFSKRGRHGHAHGIAERHFTGRTEALRFDYPFTTEVDVNDPRYLGEIGNFYETSARILAARLDAGQDVALLCEGDPFFYGSSMHVLDRLGASYPSEIVPGVTGMSGCWTRARLPMTHGDDVMLVLPGTLDENSLVERLGGCDAAVVMKLGRNLPKVRAALARTGLTDRALYVERGTMEHERILPFAELLDDRVPYFALVLIPGRQRPR